MKTFKEIMNESKFIDEFRQDIVDSKRTTDKITTKGVNKLLIKSNKRLNDLIDDWTRPSGHVVKTVSPQINLQITKSGKTGVVSWIELEVKPK